MRDVNPIAWIILVVIAIILIDIARWVYSCMNDPEDEYTLVGALSEWWYVRVQKLFSKDGGGRPTGT